METILWSSFWHFSVLSHQLNYENNKHSRQHLRKGITSNMEGSVQDHLSPWARILHLSMLPPWITFPGVFYPSCSLSWSRRSELWMGKRRRLESWSWLKDVYIPRLISSFKNLHPPPKKKKKTQSNFSYICI